MSKPWRDIKHKMSYSSSSAFVEYSSDKPLKLFFIDGPKAGTTKMDYIAPTYISFPKYVDGVLVSYSGITYCKAGQELGRFIYRFVGDVR
jgi:hypothetical protein